MGVMTAAPSDEELAERAAGGEERAFEELVRRYTRPLLGLCLRLMGERPEAEDMVQEAFLKAYRGLASYDPSRAFASWLFRIAQNGCIDALRARKSWSPLPTTEPPAKEPLRMAWESGLPAAIAALPGRYRAVLQCKYGLGLTAAETADRLDMSPGNVRVCIHRAIKMLREELS